MRSRVSLPTRVAVIQPIDVGQHDEEVGVDQVRDERGQSIVVTESNLFGRDRVVLVDERQRAHLQQLVQRALRVSIVSAAHDVFGGQQHLADCDCRAWQMPRYSGEPTAPGQCSPPPAGSPGHADGREASAARVRPRWRQTKPRQSRCRLLVGAANASASDSMRAVVDTVRQQASDDEPTLTTMRRRGAHGRPPPAAAVTARAPTLPPDGRCHAGCAAARRQPPPAARSRRPRRRRRSQ